MAHASQLHTDMPLCWHAWRIQPQRVERMGAALVEAAHGVPPLAEED